ncbi:MAG TPA: hypothetical protein VH331_01000 [Allosphingosinicella sp.]|jgi:hypothetical protein|nr:hypothetical protein [Allosphingosinicella sp.]
MSRTVLLATAALALAATASPAAAHVSWGKPNVGFAEYRIDADQCSNAAFDAKLWFEPIYEVVRAGYAASTDLFSYARAQQIIRHGVTVTVADQLQAAVDRCLVDRGYTRFRLTEDQARNLSRFHRGTIERAHFLHRLASDPGVMAAQAIRTVRPPEGPADEGKPTRKEPLHVIDLLPLRADISDPGRPG